jgi:acyl dehydratase
MSYKFKGKKYDEFQLNDVFYTAARTITEADVVNFAGLSGDYNPIHTDEEFCKSTPLKTRVVHGMLTVAIATGLANQLGIFEGTTIALLSMNINYKAVIRIGDTIKLKLTVAEKKETSKPDRGIITLNTEILNQRDETVIDGKWVVMLQR